MWLVQNFRGAKISIFFFFFFKCRKNIFEAASAKESLSFLNFAHEMPVDFTKVFDLAQKHALTFYDASYLQLAIDLKLPLATYDQQLIEAAKAEKVKLVADCLES